MNMLLALAPLVLLILGFSAYCLVALSRSEETTLPKWAWALIILLSQPAGGIAYLALGRRERPAP